MKTFRRVERGLVRVKRAFHQCYSVLSNPKENSMLSFTEGEGFAQVQSEVSLVPFCPLQSERKLNKSYQASPKASRCGVLWSAPWGNCRYVM